jgi:phosphomannomutase
MNAESASPAAPASTGVLMFSVSGARGVVGHGLDSETACRLAAAFGTRFGPGRVVVGRDTRPSGAMLFHAVAAGLSGTGCDVLDLGVATTPTVQILVEEEQAAGGIIVTASHNPSEWNALKFVSPRGDFLERDASQGLQQTFREGAFRWRRDGFGRVVVRPGADDVHLARVLALPLLQTDRIAARGFEVVVDCVNGAASAIAPRLLSALGCRVTVVHGTPDGRFPRGPEPVAKNLRDLSQAVRHSGAHVGFALDPDGDRLALVAAGGAPLGEEMTLALAADLVLSHTPGPVVANVSSSRLIDDVAARYGVTAHRSPVGEANVVSAMRATGAVVGGEGNGGVILPRAHYGRDALVGMALVLELMAERQADLADIAGALPSYVIDKAVVRGVEPDMDALAAALRQEFTGATIDQTDGLKFLWEDAWVHVRRSGTEPVVRIIAESRDARRTFELIQTVQTRLSRP